MIKRRGLAALLLSVLLLAGCSVERLSGEPSGTVSDFTIEMPDGFRDAPKADYARLQSNVDAYADSIEADGGELGAIEVETLWQGQIGGEPVEIDVQAEQVGSIDLEGYNKLADQTLQDIPNYELEAEGPFPEFDGEEAVSVDMSFAGAPGLTTLLIGTAVKDGVAYNLTLAAPDAKTRESGRPILEEVAESWAWG